VGLTPWISQSSLAWSTNNDNEDNNINADNVTGSVAELYDLRGIKMDTKQVDWVGGSKKECVYGIRSRARACCSRRCG
jgi:hypothetical protein